MRAEKRGTLASAIWVCYVALARKILRNADFQILIMQIDTQATDQMRISVAFMTTDIALVNSKADA